MLNFRLLKINDIWNVLYTAGPNQGVTRLAMDDEVAMWCYLLLYASDACAEERLCQGHVITAEDVDLALQWVKQWEKKNHGQ